MGLRLLEGCINYMTIHTFSFIYCSTEKASASLRSSPNALIKEFRTKILGFIPSALITLNAFIACSDSPCKRMQEYKNNVIRYTVREYNIKKMSEVQQIILSMKFFQTTTNNPVRETFLRSQKRNMYTKHWYSGKIQIT